MDNTTEENWPRLLSGTFCFYHQGKTVADCFSLAMNALKLHFPEVPLTHIGGSYDMGYKFVPATDKAIKHFLTSGYRSITAESYIGKDAVVNVTPTSLRLSAGDFHARGVECMLLEFSFREPLFVEKGNECLHVLDSMALEMNCEAGNFHDLEDASNQIEASIYWFKLMGETVPRSKRVWDTLMEEEVVDVEQNPGHCHVIEAVTFTTVWTNYLGRDFLNHLGFEKAQEVVPILEDIAHEIVVLGDSLVRVTLFEDPFAFDRPENIERMWQFRRRLRIDEIAHALLPDCEKPSRYIPLSEKENL